MNARKDKTGGVRMGDSMYLSPAEYAETMGMNAVSVRRMCERGELGAIRVGSRWRIPLDVRVPERREDGELIMQIVLRGLDDMSKTIDAMLREIAAAQGK